jgi:hypothetical protein
MGQAFTIYNCGTNFHRDSNDAVARLWRQTLQHECMITDGPGSGTWKPTCFGGRANPGGASKLGGLLFGTGADKNVEGAIKILAGIKPLPRIVNLCGWSRGGVTCAKIANMMHRMGPPFSLIKVNIFAIDPVPGSNAGSGSMWQHITLTQNIVYYHALLSQHDMRGVDDFFQPTYPSHSGSTKVDVDIMPGTHSSILVFKGGKEETAELTTDMAKRFLKSHGTQFTDESLYSANDILRRYGLIQEDFPYYSKLKGKNLVNIESLKRVVMDSGKTVVGSLSMAKPRFFINEHHRETFRLLYPYLTSEIDRQSPAKPFVAATMKGWMPELNRLMAANVEQARPLLAFAMLNR